MVFQLDLDNEVVGEIQLEPPLRAKQDSDVRSVFAAMKDSAQDGVLICEEEELLGVFTERDALKLMASGSDLSVAVKDVMTTSPETIRDDETVKSAIKKMASGGYRRLPVVDQSGRPVGVLKVSMILHYLVQHFPQQVYNLPPSPNQVTLTREGA